MQPRRTKQVTIKGQKFTIRQLMPVDMADGFWPFCFYHVANDPVPVAVKIEWGIKPQDVIESEANTENVYTRAVVDPVIDFTTLDEDIRRDLMIEIFRVSYGVDIYGSTVNRKWLEWVYFHCKTFGGLEPWVYVYGNESPAAGLNPMRWDFNTVVMRVGVDREKEIKAQREAEAAANG